MEYCRSIGCDYQGKNEMYPEGTNTIIHYTTIGK